MAQYDQRSEPIVDFPNGLHLYVYNVNEEIEAQVRCNYAIYHQNEELWELRKDVEAVNTNGDVINTELMFWDTRNKRSIQISLSRSAQIVRLSQVVGLSPTTDLKTTKYLTSVAYCI